MLEAAVACCKTTCSENKTGEDYYSVFITTEQTEVHFITILSLVLGHTAFMTQGSCGTCLALHVSSVLIHLLV